MSVYLQMKGKKMFQRGFFLPRKSEHFSKKIPSLFSEKKNFVPRTLFVKTETLFFCEFASP